MKNQERKLFSKFNEGEMRKSQKRKEEEKNVLINLIRRKSLLRVIL